MTEEMVTGKICIVCVGIVIAIVWIIIHPLSFCIALFVGIGFYAVYKYSKKEEEARRLEEFDRKKHSLISSDNYRYVRNFVKKYRGTYDSEKISKLRALLSKKGLPFDDEEINWLIAEEIQMQNYEDFETRILYNKPSRLEDYIRNLIEIYGDNYQQYIDFFKNLLRAKRLSFNEELISEEIEKVKKEIELTYFERKLDSEQLRSISIDDLDLITGHKFEHFLKTLFEKMGYRVEQTKLSQDQGADLIISKFGEKIVVQAKRYSHKVGNKAIQEVVAAIKHYGADRGMVITTSEFTRPAVRLAISNNIELIDRYKLEKLVRKYL